MMFKCVFLYAVCRGVLDALMRRPGLQQRLMYVRFERAVRAANKAVREFTGSVLRLAQKFERFAREYRSKIEEA